MLKDVIRRELDRYDDWWIAPADLNIVAENIAEAISKGPKYSISASVHWPECWRYTSHHACAVALVCRQAGEVERLRAAMVEVLEWATGDGDQDLIETAAREALGEEAA